MSANDFILDAKLREDAGKGASRRLRREASHVPAIVYGGRKKPQMVSIEFKTLVKHLENEAFYSHIIELNIEGKSESVLLKDLQRHPSKPTLYHADFLRVSKTQKLRTRVPLHFINESTSVGVKTQGGQVLHNMTDIEISCLPANLPEYIEVDLGSIELGQIVHISDIALPKGVESVALAHGSDHDSAVATISVPKGIVEDDADSSEASSDDSTDSAE